ncbi:uncharacterized protein [Dermacentor andersoni]|uniref:uncharacterized protein isoform X5 n=1 Tax=Dermacentor andersoni TaxID=34620 RepID=UPI003B3BCDA4
MRRLTSPAGVLVVAAALLAAAQARKQASCPQAAFLMPCRCIEASIGLRILCSGIRSTHHLEVPFSYLRAYDLNALTLQHVNFSITVDLFKGLNVVTIKILHSTFRVSPMQGHNDATIVFGSMLQGLDVRHTDLDLGDAHLGATDSLRHVMVDTSTIEVLRRNWFHGLTRLKSFSIENTRIERVEDEALSGLDSVEEIKLPSNRLQKVRRTYFPQLASNLRHLDLRNPLYITQEGRCKDIRMSKRQPSATSRSTEQRTPKNQNTLPCNLDKKTRMWVYWLYHLTKCQRNQNTVCHTKMKILTCSRQSS